MYAKKFKPRLDRFHEYEISVSRMLNTRFRRRLGLYVVDVKRARRQDGELGFIVLERDDSGMNEAMSFVEDSEVL